MSFRFPGPVSLAIILLACASPATAHHSTAFYSSEFIELEGEIARIDWVNPHGREASLWLDSPARFARTGAAMIRNNDVVVDAAAENRGLFRVCEAHRSFDGEGHDTVRVIHMDRAEPPPGEAASILGYSVGRWENGDLVVTTTLVDWPYFDNIGTPQSRDVEFVERFSLSGEQSRLHLAGGLRVVHHTVPVKYVAALADPVDIRSDALPQARIVDQVLEQRLGRLRLAAS